MGQRTSLSQPVARQLHPPAPEVTCCPTCAILTRQQRGELTALRILLLNPKSKLPIDTRISPPLGLAYLAAVAEQQGDLVHIHDGDVEDTFLPAVVREFVPDVVGITANTPQITAAWCDAAVIRSISNAPIFLGGPHPTTLPEESAAKPSVDVVVRGEGEVTWLELLSVLKSRP